MKRWALEIDVKRCINCSNCVLATKDEYFGNVFPGYSAEQPHEGVETIKIVRHVRGDGSFSSHGLVAWSWLAAKCRLAICPIVGCV